MLFLLLSKRNLYEKAFSCAETKTNSHFVVNLAEMLKEVTIHLCLFDESHFSNICGLQYVTIECIIK